MVIEYCGNVIEEGIDTANPYLIILLGQFRWMMYLHEETSKDRRIKSNSNTIETCKDERV